ncbi:MAG: hypothetical protein HRT74_08120, partial [Flavobacteriales bacterium]|nr:hypothetical protein [Flavobacteriales bacterium]
WFLGTLGGGLNLFQDSIWFRIKQETTWPYPAFTIEDMVSNKSCLYYGGWDNSIQRYDDKTGEVRLFGFIGGTEQDYSGNESFDLEIVNQQLWVASRFEGLWCFDLSNGNSTNYLPETYNDESILSNSLKCLFRDEQERVWIGSDKGLSCYDPQLFQFETHYLGGSSLTANGSETVFTLKDIDSTLFIGTKTGLWTWDYLKDESPKREETIPQDLQVHSIYQTKDQRIWIGTNKTLFYLNEGEEELHQLKGQLIPEKGSGFDVWNLQSTRITSMIESDLEGEPILLVGVYGYGTLLVHLETLNCAITGQFMVDDSGKYTGGDALFNDLLIGPDSSVWSLTRTLGVAQNPQISTPSIITDLAKTYSDLRIPTASMEVARLKSKQLKADSVLHNLSATDFLQLNENQCVLAVGNGGLRRGQKKGDSWNWVIDSSHVGIERMIQDESGQVWSVSSSGLDRWGDNGWQRYDSREGFPDPGLTAALVEITDGRVICGGQGYLVSFVPKDLSINEILPKTVISGLVINGENNDHLLMEKGIDLDYQQNDFQFQFSALNYTRPERNTFKYRLIGSHTEWVYAGSRNEVSYQDLPHGEYRFELLSANNNGVWNQQAALFEFVVKPPFWRTYWFYALVLIAIVLSLILWFRMRIRRVESEQRLILSTEMRGMDKERERLAKDLHDDLGMKLSTLKLLLNAIQNVTSSEKGGELSEKAQGILDDSVDGLRQLMSNLSPQIVQQNGLLKAADALAKKANANSNMNVTVEGEFDPNILEMERQVSTYRVIQELFQNAWKHSGASEVKVVFSESESHVLLTYTDNGVGLKTLKHGPSHLGMGNMKNRVEVMNGIIEFGHPSQGTEIKISVPKNGRE